MVGSKLQKRRRGEPSAPPAPETPGLVTAHARARKPGLGGAPPPAKRLKSAPDAASIAPPAPVAVAAAPAPLPAPQGGVAAPQARTVARPLQQTRISDLLAADRQRRSRASVGPPAIVAGAPHMDSRRPAPADTQKVAGPGAPAGRKRLGDGKAVGGVKVIKARARKPPLPPTSSLSPFRPPEPRPAAVPVKKPTAAAALSERPVLSRATSAKIKAPGGEALRYDRTLLPDKHNLLLDILGGLEQAESLLATRHAIPEFAAVRKIVASVTKRTFTVRHLSQLAATVPEAVAVLPPKETVKQTTARSKAAVASASALAARRNDRLVIRLDDVTDFVNGVAPKKGNTPARTGRLGDAAARGRHRLLLTRLREHAEDWHSRFLRRECLKDFAGSLWHPKFRPGRHIADLPAPPLYPPAAPSQTCKDAVANPHAEDASAEVAAISPLGHPVSDKPLSAVDDLLMAPSHGAAEEQSASASSPSTPRKSKDAVPSALLARVRAREAAKVVRTLDAPAAAERLLLAQLPATLDAVRSVLSSRGRGAMGWAALTAATAAAHPGGRKVAEVATHMDALAVLAAAWCEKRPLSGPRGGHAFRIVDDARFAEARRAVVSAKSLPR